MGARESVDVHDNSKTNTENLIIYRARAWACTGRPATAAKIRRCCGIGGDDQRVSACQQCSGDGVRERVNRLSGVIFETTSK